ncbi:hypothetical protein DFH08DRAFT_826235 [Mycena albidolilacea]|uniref:Uncharacterized protein n=1 Tax=Mycena albidolilacea TaxID=1033008 RepID=A0AAD6Z1Q2_9AGAR|nr:hypothetical protein DFH08DRAFT_826235 [Mycena albidolilacea]
MAEVDIAQNYKDPTQTQLRPEQYCRMIPCVPIMILSLMRCQGAVKSVAYQGLRSGLVPPLVFLSILAQHGSDKINYKMFGSSSNLDLAPEFKYHNDEEVGVVPLGKINCDGREIPASAPDLSESDDQEDLPLHLALPKSRQSSSAVEDDEDITMEKEDTRSSTMSDIQPAATPTAPSPSPKPAQTRSGRNWVVVNAEALWKNTNKTTMVQSDAQVPDAKPAGFISHVWNCAQIGSVMHVHGSGLGWVEDVICVRTSMLAEVVKVEYIEPASQWLFPNLMMKTKGGDSGMAPGANTVPTGTTQERPAAILQIFNTAVVQPTKGDENSRLLFSPQILELTAAGIYLEMSIFTNEHILDMFVNQSDLKYQLKKQTILNDEGKTVTVYTLDPSIFGRRDDLVTHSF